jgi:hypothetical protein
VAQGTGIRDSGKGRAILKKLNQGQKGKIPTVDEKTTRDTNKSVTKTV